MKYLKISFVLIAAFLLQSIARADEGMWIPMLLKKYNIEEMQKLGFKLSAEDVYSINQSSLKDAVMIFGGGCTGELISDQGLLITNHHCGYGYIQKHSSLEHDYLTDGFWAMNKDEELVNPGLSVRFLVEMHDVTEEILKGVNADMSQEDRSKAVSENIKVLKKKAEDEYKKEIVIKPFYHGNQYFMFVNEVYKDVRLVGAPPSAIGKFGGDTDNWMWPRHTGDFSLFRIYTAPDGSPAEYSKENIPMRPKRHFPISLKGVDKGDFTMVFGYPGTTMEYVPSYELDLTMNVTNPTRIDIRTRILNEMKAGMESDPLIRIQYSSKAAGVANGWKKWIGENRGLKRLDAINVKRTYEQQFNAWAANNSYAKVMDMYSQTYKDVTPYQKNITALSESLRGIEVLSFVGKINKLVQLADADKTEEVAKELESFKLAAEAFFKDYNMETSKAIAKTVMEYYINEIDKEYWPKAYMTIEKKGMDKVIDKAFDKSVFTDKDRMMEMINSGKINTKSIKKDFFYTMRTDFINIYFNNLAPHYNTGAAVIDSLDRVYMKGQMEFQPNRVFYPDANFTLRVAYGQVDNYFPKDGVIYKHFTTLEGIIEKNNPDIYDYDVPDRLLELYNNKDYGQYADPRDNKVHVCFIAKNHTTGGNSGSPVLDAEGNLIGVNFDRNWEGTMSDLMYDPDMCRNITLDIRYAMFIIDKFAGASHLVEEMTIVK